MTLNVVMAIILHCYTLGIRSWSPSCVRLVEAGPCLRQKCSFWQCM